ncbi:MAG: hypothetical protein R2791_13575 [Saprospiraceae bacterium]
MPEPGSDTFRTPSKIAFWLCAALMAATCLFYYPKWKQANTEATLSWDVSGYYLYLPAALIYHDIRQLNWWEAVDAKYHPGPGMGQAFQHPSGNYVMKYPMGQALQFLPWFAAAHLLAAPLGFPADGFSLPYQAAISWGSLLIALLGLWFARRNLLAFFPERTVAAVLICLVFGTNYLEYTAITGAMTHNWLFTLYSLLIFTTMRFYERPTALRAAAIGLLVGWATLTRPTEIISALIPLLWGIDGRSAFRARLAFFKEHFRKMALAVLVAGAVIFLQALYWKFASGDWIVYSYQDQGFSWLRPHLSDVLFSARAGWLVYSPMMLFAVAGLFFLRAQLRWVVLIFCLAALYITAAWDIWWYGGSLGQRAMVQAYPLWVFALAAFVEWVRKPGRPWKHWAFTLLACVFIYINLWWTHQAHRGGLFVSEQMTKRYMLKVLGRFEAQRDWLKLLDTKEEFKGAERREVRQVFSEDFENARNGTTDEAAIAGNRSFLLNNDTQFTPEYEVPVHAADGDWVRVSLTFRCSPKEWDWWRMTQLIVRFRSGERMLKERMIRLQRHVDGEETRTVFFDTRLPKEAFDRAGVLVWNAGSDKAVRLDDLRVEVFR